MRYEVRFESRAWRALQKLDEQTRSRLEKAIYALAENPRPPGCRKLAGTKGVYRIRVGICRAAYRIEEDVLVVLVIAVGYRRDIDRQLWRS